MARLHCPSTVGLWAAVCNPKCAHKIEWYRSENTRVIRTALGWKTKISTALIALAERYGSLTCAHPLLLRPRSSAHHPRFVICHGPVHILQTSTAHHHALSVASSPWYLSMRLRDTVDIRPGQHTEHPLPLRTPTLTITGPQQRRSNITNTTFDSAEHPCL